MEFFPPRESRPCLINTKKKHADKNDSLFASPFASTSNWPIKVLSSETISVIWRFRSKHHKFFWCAILQNKEYLGFLRYLLFFFSSSSRGHQKGEDEDSEVKKQELDTRKHLSLRLSISLSKLFFLFFRCSRKKRDRTAECVSRLEWPQFTSSIWWILNHSVMCLRRFFSFPFFPSFSIELNKKLFVSYFSPGSNEDWNSNFPSPGSSILFLI